MRRKSPQPNWQVVYHIVTVVVLIVIGIPMSSLPATAQTASSTPFITPFAAPPGPETWLLAQPYGNTEGAYRRRDTTYAAVQGIHFGVDLRAPCGAEIVAIADGVVFAADNMGFGSEPHNLMIDHPDLGYASFYGHLLARPQVEAGQRVEAGQVVALSGDDDDDGCEGSGHLHLEIRDLAHVRKYNPLPLIDADWDNIALYGSSGRDFQRDLDHPRRWQHLDDQPEVIIGGPLINEYANTWPPDFD